MFFRKSIAIPKKNKARFNKLVRINDWKCFTSQRSTRSLVQDPVVVRSDFVLPLRLPGTFRGVSSRLSDVARPV